MIPRRLWGVIVCKLALLACALAAALQGYWYLMHADVTEALFAFAVWAICLGGNVWLDPWMERGVRAAEAETEAKSEPED